MYKLLACLLDNNFALHYMKSMHENKFRNQRIESNPAKASGARTSSDS